MRQSDSEAQLLDWIHLAADAKEPVILNAGGLTHTSIALRDACAELSAPLIEVHISNVFAREEFRRHSYLSPVATGVIVGCGVQGYLLALRYLASLAASRSSDFGFSMCSVAGSECVGRQRLGLRGAGRPRNLLVSSSLAAGRTDSVVGSASWL